MDSNWILQLSNKIASHKFPSLPSVQEARRRRSSIFFGRNSLEDLRFVCGWFLNFLFGGQKKEETVKRWILDACERTKKNLHINKTRRENKVCVILAQTIIIQEIHFRLSYVHVVTLKAHILFPLFREEFLCVSWWSFQSSKRFIAVEKISVIFKRLVDI